MEHRLTRSADDRMIAGVCGGIAAYAGIDSTLVRLALVLFSIVAGAGVLMYLLAWFVIPDATGERQLLPLLLVLLAMLVPGGCCALTWLSGVIAALAGWG